MLRPSLRPLGVAQRDSVGIGYQALRDNPVKHLSHRLPIDRVNHVLCRSHKLMSAIQALGEQPRPSHAGDAGFRHGHSYPLLAWPKSLDHLLTRLSMGLAMTEAAYLEAWRLRDL